MKVRSTKRYSVSLMLLLLFLLWFPANCLFITMLTNYPLRQRQVLDPPALQPCQAEYMCITRYESRGWVFRPILWAVSALFVYMFVIWLPEGTSTHGMCLNARPAQSESINCDRNVKLGENKCNCLYTAILGLYIWNTIVYMCAH